MDSLSIEQSMKAIPAEIEVYPVHHLPIIKAYADKLGLVDLINHARGGQRTGQTDRLL
jgi:hypothetical protein